MISRKLILRAFAGLIIAVAAVYAGDTVLARLRGYPAATVELRVVYAIPSNNGRIEYSRGEPQTAQCVQSLFPHGGLEPCWYLERHTTKVIRY